MKHSATNSPKFRKFVRALRARMEQLPFAVETVAVGLLERLWHATMVSTPRGDIGSHRDEDIAEMVGWHGDAAELIDLLVECGWLDRCDTYRLVVHDWHEHAPTYLKGNIRRRGDLFVTEEVPDHEPPRDPPKQSTKDAPKEFSKEDTKYNTKHPTPNLTQPNLTQPPPPTPSPHGVRPDTPDPPTPSSAPTSTGEDPLGEEEVLRELRSAGVSAPKCLPDALKRGFDLHTVRQLIRHFQEHRTRMGWEPQALHFRLTQAFIDQPVASGWPAPLPEKKQEIQREEQQKMQASQRDKQAQEQLQSRREQQAAKARDATEYRRLEKMFGSALDALDRTSQLALAQEVNVYLQKQVAKSGATGRMLRSQLLRRMEEKARGNREAG